MATTAPMDRQAVRATLGGAIRRSRQDCPPMETARLLLAHDGPGQRLIGLRHDGERVVFYDDTGGSAIAATFDGAGLDDRGGVRIARLRSVVEAARWVEKLGPYWAWRHPRFE